MSSLIENQIDREYLSDISGGDFEFECELIEAFCQTAPSLIEDYRTAVSTNNLQGIRHAAHTLKGSSRAIGAVPFGFICEAAEEAARNGDIDKCAQCLDRVVEAFGVLNSACGAFVAEAA